MGNRFVVDWNGATNRAANNVRTDATGTYDDWSLPTVEELQLALADGMLQLVIPLKADGTALYPRVSVWTSNTRGSKSAYYMDLWVDRATGLIDYRRSGHMEVLGKFYGTEVFFVR